MYCQISKWDKYTKVMLSGTCFMSFTNYPLDEQLCRVLSVSHSNSIHEVEIGHILIALSLRSGLLQVVLRGSISYNTEFQRPLQYKLELRHLPDNYTFMVLEDAMYSVQVCTASLISARLLHTWNGFYSWSQLKLSFLSPLIIGSNIDILQLLRLPITSMFSSAIFMITSTTIYWI